MTSGSETASPIEPYFPLHLKHSEENFHGWQCGCLKGIRAHLDCQTQIKYPISESLPKCFEPLSRYVAEPMYVQVDLKVV